MKAAVITAPGNVAMLEVPDLPPTGEYQVKCRNLFFAACTGTDRKLIHNQVPWGAVSYPAVLGHESVGEVLEVGAGVRNFRPGDLVLRPVYGYAGTTVNGLGCEFGGFSEFGVVTDYRAMREDGREDYSGYCRFQMKIPAAWRNFKESVLLITMKETMSYLLPLGSFYNKRVAVIGAGAVGMFFIKFISLQLPARLTAFASSLRARDRVRTVGADELRILDLSAPPDEQYDVVVDSAGILGQLEQAIRLVRSGGTYATYGIGDTMDCCFRGFGSGIHFAFHSQAEDDPTVHELCVRAVERGLVDLTQFRSGIFPFEQLPEVFERIARKQEFKPIFTL